MEILTTLANWAQIIGLPVAIIALVATTWLSIWFYRKGKQKRAISCVFDSVVSPIEIKAGEALKGEIEIRYRGKAVENLFVVRVHLKNTGNMPIRKSDFVEPIRFTFAPGAEFIRLPLVTEKKPKELKCEWEFSTLDKPPVVNSFSVIFDLLNPGDELTVEFVCIGDGQIPTASARVEGMSQIDVISPHEAYLLKYSRSIVSFPAIFGIVVMLALVVSFTLLGFDSLRSLNVFGILLATFAVSGSISMLWSILSPTIDLLRLRRQKNDNRLAKNG